VSSFTAIENDDEHRQDQQQADRSADDVDSPLDQARGAGEADRGQPEQRQALDGVKDDLLPERLVEARHDVDLNVQLAEEPNRLEGLVVSIVREREDHPVDASFAYEARQVVGASEDLQLLQIAPLVLRPRVDEPDQPHAVFGMLEELSADHLADRSCADDDGVLDIGREPTGEGTRAASRQRHRHDREQPERRELLLIRVSEAGHP